MVVEAGGLAQMLGTLNKTCATRWRILFGGCRQGCSPAVCKGTREVAGHGGDVNMMMFETSRDLLRPLSDWLSWRSVPGG